MRLGSLIGAVFLLLLTGCKKDPEVVPDNVAPYYDGIPTVVVQYYVNRLYIDLIGREPLDNEMSAEVAALEAAALSIDARATLVIKLMTDQAYIEGDSSYKHAYYQRQYDLYKARCLEGASEAILDQYIGIADFAALSDSLAGDSAAYAKDKREADKLKAVKRSRIEYRNGTIGIREVFRRMIYNAVYDQINMNTFNYVNATFDDLFTRFPTETEFGTAYGMIETNTPGILFGQPGQNKQDYGTILTSTTEFDEGVIRWCYRTFLARDASTYEVYQAMTHFHTTHDLQEVQRTILISDEYANFR